MRSRECLMQIQMEHVKSHIARTYDTHERIHIRAIILEQTAALMNEGCNLENLLLEESECVRIGHHDTSDSVV